MHDHRPDPTQAHATGHTGKETDVRRAGRTNVYKLNIIERSYELARSGDFSGATEIGRQLSAEGYLNVSAHLASPALRKALLHLCRQSRGKPVRPPPRRIRDR